MQWLAISFLTSNIRLLCSGYDRLVRSNVGPVDLHKEGTDANLQRLAI